MQENQTLSFNKPQLRLMALNPHSSTNIWSRGTGKSTAIGWKIKQITEEMPRSSWIILGQTYKQILTRTLPSTIASLERLGMKQNLHYFIKTRPPKSWGWETSYEPPVEFEHYISTYTGAGFHLVSLDSGGSSSRGLNVDGIIADESLLINKEKFEKDVLATNRGNRRYFSKIPYHHGVFHFSSMPYGEQGRWLLDSGKYLKELGNDFRDIRNELIKLQLKFIDNKDTQYRLRLWPQIEAYKKQLRFTKNKADAFLYQEADIFDNIKNVGLKYIEQQRRDMADLMFMVEILNWYPEEIEGGFYPHLSREKHGYKDSFANDYLTSFDIDSDKAGHVNSRWDKDCIPNLPLRIAVDWGAKITCLSVCQHYESIRKLRFLKNLYVKHPKILDDLAQAFCDYYSTHPNKNVVFAYDHTGNTHQSNSNLTYAEQFAKILTARGWTVTMNTHGAAMTHQNKYLLWSKILRNEDPSLPTVEFNLDNCSSLWLSMKNAPAKEGPKGIEKNKASERNPFIPQEEATHLSDTADIQLVSLFSSLLNKYTSFIDVMGF